jgi:hypothetical protein
MVTSRIGHVTGQNDPAIAALAADARRPPPRGERAFSYPETRMQPIQSLGIDVPGDVEPITAAERLSRYRRKTIVALTAGMSPTPRSALIDAAFALRRAARGPSKLARRLRRKAQLGLAGAF